MEEVWLRQSGESSKAYAAFKKYLELGRHGSIRKLGQKYGKSRATLERWSSDNSWQKRRDAYYDYLDRKELETYEQEVKEMNQRQAEAGRVMQQAAMDKLNSMDPKDINQSIMVMLLNSGTKIEREALIPNLDRRGGKQKDEGITTRYANDGLREALEALTKKVWNTND